MAGEALYRRFLDGDIDAAEELISLYGKSLHIFICGFVRDADCAEEIAIEAFARLMVRGAKFKGESSLKTYLFAIARNLSLNYLKKHRHEKHISFEDLAGEQDQKAEHVPEEYYLRREKSRQLFKAMQILKQEHREVVHLLFFEGMSYAEAGKVLGKSAKQIDGLVSYAKQKLRLELEKAGVTGYEE